MIPVGAKTLSPYATWEYSRISPLSRFWRRTRTFAPREGLCGRSAGGLCCSAQWADERCSDRCIRSGSSSPGLAGTPARSARTVSVQDRCRVLEDLPHRRRREHVAQADQLAVNAPVSPARVIPRHLQHQRPHGRGSPGPPRVLARTGPATPDQAGVPAPHGPGRDNQAQPAEFTAGSSRASAARTARQPMRTSQPRGGLVRSWLFSRLTRCQGKSRLTLVQRNPVNAAGSSTVGAGRSVVRDSLGPGASGAAAAGDAADGDAGPRERQCFTPYRAG